MKTFTALEVNDEPLSLAAVLRSAKLNGMPEFIQAAIEAALIRQYAAKQGFVISDEELQRAADDFRAARELFTEEATGGWLAARRLSYADWESLLEQEVLTRRVRAHVTVGQAQQYFAQHRLAFDVAVIHRIVVRDEDTARELRAQLVEESADFFTLARLHSLDAATRRACGYVGEIWRDELDAVAEAAVFGAKPGKVIGPLKTDLGWQLIRVSEIRKAAFDEATRAEIETRLFAEWLGELHRKACINFPLLDLAGDDPDEDENEGEEETVTVV